MKKKEVAIENCPLCGSKDLEFLIEARDWRGSDERFRIIECDVHLRSPALVQRTKIWVPIIRVIHMYRIRIGQKGCSTAFILKFKSEIKEIN